MQQIPAASQWPLPWNQIDFSHFLRTKAAAVEIEAHGVDKRGACDCTQPVTSRQVASQSQPRVPESDRLEDARHLFIIPSSFRVWGWSFDWVWMTFKNRQTNFCPHSKYKTWIYSPQQHKSSKIHSWPAAPGRLICIRLIVSLTYLPAAGPTSSPICLVFFCLFFKHKKEKKCHLATDSLWDKNMHVDSESEGAPTYTPSLLFFHLFHPITYQRSSKKTTHHIYE